MGKKMGTILDFIWTFVNDVMHADSDKIRKDAVGIHNIDRPYKGKNRIKIPWKGIVAGLTLLVIAVVIFAILWSTIQ